MTGRSKPRDWDERFDEEKSRASLAPRDEPAGRSRALWIAASLLGLIVLFVLVVYMAAYRW